MDYALGHAPGARDGILTFSLTTDVITLSYMQDLAADNVTLTAEWSTKLLDWQPLGAGFDLISLLPDGGGRQTIVYASNPMTFPRGERIFIRLKTAQ